MNPLPDRRREPRTSSEEPLTVSLLGASAESSLSCTTIDSSGRGLRILSPDKIASGTLLCLENAHHTLLGEVLRCDPAGDRHLIGIRLSHSLEHSSGLAALSRSLKGEARGKDSFIMKE